ncbi:hypothetical protein A1Q1_07711 [Trichosporon asahii var. asahii CBS 2479]|uniref:Uncharacterized protein n=1 Tax=Trichosporon asahii var. asahii (strain ATCC 90039 / CBS 2479 / JCM 2466 / KCTC 7840 / NBRC 103889/ NCYC 2677 / UAMH 7654) TaxID=1186058 RepID=J5TIS4_TRIAS|nr:hypothetical protein A1Q1_07711 [Trichosporon asahii var. asahii CBS 2479]EJT51116.1 hypothetical protein A1Q1_07711 [Trichosporon asahii var. asahii CBS 2479]
MVGLLTDDVLLAGSSELMLSSRGRPSLPRNQRGCVEPVRNVRREMSCADGLDVLGIHSDGDECPPLDNSSSLTPSMLTSSLFTLATLVRRQFGDHLGHNGNVTWPIQTIPYEEDVPANCSTPCNSWKEATRKGACAIPLPSSLPPAAQTSALPDGSKLAACPIWTMRNEDVCAVLDVQAQCLLCAFPELNETAPEYVASYGGVVKDCQEQGFRLPESVPGINMQDPTSGAGEQTAEANAGTPWDQVYNPPPANTPAVAAAQSPSSSSAAAPSATTTSGAARLWSHHVLALGLTALSIVAIV